MTRRAAASAGPRLGLAALALALMCLVHPLEAKYHVRVQSVERHAHAPAPEAFVPEPVATRPQTAASAAYKPKTVEHTFTLRWEKLSLDGAEPKPRITINGQYPGPTIVGTQGDRLVVKVRRAGGWRVVCTRAQGSRPLRKAHTVSSHNPRPAHTWRRW